MGPSTLLFYGGHPRYFGYSLNMIDLFTDCRPEIEEIYPDCFVLAHFFNPEMLKEEIDKIIRISPLRKMMTPNGHYTGVALTNCGDLGWTSSERGYQYSKIDPQTANAWPAIPSLFLSIAEKAALMAGFKNFQPNACLINRYLIGDKLGSHQDKNEQDYSQPIVSLSIGLAAIFQIFGQNRTGVKKNYRLLDGDVMVWGNRSRLIYHGVRALCADRLNPRLKQRVNITLRKAN
jgi:DNA oxidative demethylase